MKETEDTPIEELIVASFARGELEENELRLSGDGSNQAIADYSRTPLELHDDPERPTTQRLRRSIELTDAQKEVAKSNRTSRRRDDALSAGACVGRGVDNLFFNDRFERKAAKLKRYKAAWRFCGSCAVADTCRSVGEVQDAGIWGGFIFDSKLEPEAEKKTKRRKRKSSSVYLPDAIKEIESKDLESKKLKDEF